MHIMATKRGSGTAAKHVICIGNTPLVSPNTPTPSFHRMAVWVCLGLAATLVSPAGVLADDASSTSNCAACGDDPSFPQAAEFLEAHGYPPDAFSVLVSWNETSRFDPTQTVFGFHVCPTDGGEPFDLYSDQQGRLLGTSDLQKLGIRQKNWDLRPRETSSEGTSVEVGGAGAAAPSPEVVADPDAPTIVLPELDLGVVQQEDEADAAGVAKGVTRIGVFREFSMPVVASGEGASVGTWRAAPAGTRQWSVIVNSPGAKGIRVHFAARRLPDTAFLVLYNVDDPSERYDVSHGFAVGGSDIWSPTCFGDRVGVQCSLPDDVDDGGVDIQIDRIAHIYRGFETLAWGIAKDAAAKAAGSCNLDVTCHPEWATTARGVGGIGSIGSTGVLWCTGSLVVDTSPATQVPYFLTAYHCVGSSTKANTIEVYWLYQTSTCNGTPPSPASVPRTTGGADYLAGTSGAWQGGAGNDFSLLRLRQSPPSGLTYLGWSTVTRPLDTEVVCVHHPSGDYKRITFGTLTSTDNLFPALFHGVHWHDGTTEPGSSGSPLMTADTQRIIGQLWGGDASCATPDESDFYGRFDVTFPVVRTWLDGGPDPGATLSPVTYDVDESAGTLTVTVTLDQIPGGAVSVRYAASGTTASVNEDFLPAEGILAFEGMQQTATFSVTILDDLHTEDTESLTVSLSDPVGCGLSPSYVPLVITISDDDLDTDGDGLSDYDETHGVYGYLTDPNNPDTDGDGYRDFDEINGIHGLRMDPTVFSQLSGMSIPYFEDSPRAPSR